MNHFLEDGGRFQEASLSGGGRGLGSPSTTVTPRQMPLTSRCAAERLGGTARSVVVSQLSAEGLAGVAGMTAGSSLLGATCDRGFCRRSICSVSASYQPHQHRVPR